LAGATAPAFFAAPAYSCLSGESVSDCWMRSTILPSRHGQARVDLVVLGGHVVYARVEVGDAADHPPQREATARLPKGHPALGEPDADLSVAFGVDDLVKGVEVLSIEKLYIPGVNLLILLVGHLPLLASSLRFGPKRAYLPRNRDHRRLAGRLGFGVCTRYLPVSSWREFDRRKSAPAAAWTGTRFYSSECVENGFSEVELPL
jgi:hypothetical protein